MLRRFCSFSTFAAVVERSFNLAALVDTKHGQKMSPSFRKTAIMMYCNDDVEGQFGKSVCVMHTISFGEHSLERSRSSFQS